MPLFSEYPTKGQVMEEIKEALLDLNQVRPKEVLGGRTPQDVYLKDPRRSIARAAIYARWDEAREKLLRDRGLTGTMNTLVEMEAMRLAAMMVLREQKLVKYCRGLEAPEV